MYCGLGTRTASMCVDVLTPANGLCRLLSWFKSLVQYRHKVTEIKAANLVYRLDRFGWPELGSGGQHWRHETVRCEGA
jgi:hypothetical protein